MFEALVNHNTVLVGFETDHVPTLRRKSKEVKHFLREKGFEILYTLPYKTNLAIVLKEHPLRGFYLRDITGITHNGAAVSIPMINTYNTVKLFITDDLRYKSIEHRDSHSCLRCIKRRWI